MPVEIRTVAPDEMAAWGRSVSVPFLRPPKEDDPEAGRHERPPGGRAWAAVDGDRFVGNSATYFRTVNLPGDPCPVVPMAGVTAVGVHPTHRRQGILTRLMTAMLDDARERGEPVAGLIASESVIYGRFGFGVATYAARRVIDPRHGALLRPAPPADVRILDAGEAAKVIPELFARSIRATPGEVGRSGEVWERYVFADHEQWRGGRSANFYAASADAYAIYRVQEDHAADTARLHVSQVCGVTAGAEAALWAFLLGVDLVEEIEAFPCPVADPLALRLADPRRLRTTQVTDFLWLRVLDIPAALTTRRYRTPGRVVIDVAGEGRWALDAGPDGATCDRTDAGADLRLGHCELGSMLLGTVPASLLARAGRIDEDRPGALEVADAVFRPGPVAPFDHTGF